MTDGLQNKQIGGQGYCHLLSIPTTPSHFITLPLIPATDKLTLHIRQIGWRRAIVYCNRHLKKDNNTYKVWMCANKRYTTVLTYKLWCNATDIQKHLLVVRLHYSWIDNKRTENDNTLQPLDQWTNSPFMGQQVGNCKSFKLTSVITWPI